MLRGGEEQGREGRGGGRRKVQTMSIYNADAVDVSKEAFEECARLREFM